MTVNLPSRQTWKSTQLGVLVLMLASVAAPVATASSAPPPPGELRVVGGDGWRADPHFTIAWANISSGPPIAAVHYRVRDPGGGIESGPVRLGWPAENESVAVWGNGAHTAEVWLEDATGAQGPAGTVRLRLDTAPPAGVEPIRPTGWISRTELPYGIRLTHPPGTPPVSGIRGYAVSVDRDPGSSPCVAADLCTDAETDLRGGASDDTLLVDELPEGTSYLHALAVSGSQMRSVTPGHAPIRVDKTDPLTRLSGVPEGWSNRAVLLRATATDTGSGMAPSGDGAPFTAIRIDGEAPRISPGSEATATVLASGVHTVAFYARDAAGNSDDGADSNGKPNAPPATATVRIDREPPAVVFTGSAIPEEPELIEARVADGLSGPDPVRGEIALRVAGSGDPYEALPTIAAGERLLARWRSDEYPVGEYEFRVTGYDRAGNSSTGTRRANGSPMVLPNPLKSRAILVAGFAGDLGALQAGREVGYGRIASFGGRLSATSDSPLGGRSVSVIERFAPGAAIPKRTTVVATAEDGRFGLRLPPGPSREVFAVFDGTGTATGTASRPLRLGVRSGVRLSASSSLARVGGRPVVFRGAVSAAPGELPPGGASVQLQFRAAGLPWTEFRTVQANSRGRFRYAYRFSDDDSRGVRFRFRAFVPAQRDWPYEPGGSRPVAVRGL